MWTNHPVPNFKMDLDGIFSLSQLNVIWISNSKLWMGMHCHDCLCELPGCWWEIWCTLSAWFCTSIHCIQHKADTLQNNLIDLTEFSCFYLTWRQSCSKFCSLYLNALALICWRWKLEHITDFVIGQHFPGGDPGDLCSHQNCHGIHPHLLEKSGSQSELHKFKVYIEISLDQGLRLSFELYIVCTLSDRPWGWKLQLWIMCLPCKTDALLNVLSKWGWKTLILNKYSQQGPRDEL